MGRWPGSSGQIVKQIRTADYRGPVLVYAREAAFEPASHRGSARTEQPGNFLNCIAAVDFDASTVYAMASHA